MNKYRENINWPVFVMFVALMLSLYPLNTLAKQASISQAHFTTKIISRDPVDHVLVLDDTSSEVFFFSQLNNFEGQKVIHRWEYNGKVEAKKTFEVKGPRWRVYSRISLSKRKYGTWIVIISDEDGWPLETVLFKYVKSGEQPVAILPLH